MSSLYDLCQRGAVDKVRKLIATRHCARGFAERRGPLQDSPLHVAVEKNHVEVAEILLGYLRRVEIINVTNAHARANDHMCTI